jgi:hypothetical protein
MDTYGNDATKTRNEAVTSRAHERPHYGTDETDEKRPADGQEVYRVYLGTVYEGGVRDRILEGAYTVRDEGFTNPRGVPSPCWVWTGAMRGDRPYIRTVVSSYSVRSLVIRRMGMKGRARMKCNTPGCMRPNHMEIETPEDVMANARRTKPDQGRDPKTGRFLPGGCHRPHEPEVS